MLLTCSEDELRRRVVLEDRRRFGKANTLEMMETFLSNYDLMSPVPYTDTFTVDNTDLAPGDVARLHHRAFRVCIAWELNSIKENG